LGHLRCANSSLSDCNSLSMCRASAVVSPQYPVSVSPFSPRYAASFFLHLTVCSHLSCLLVPPIERNTPRATLTVNGPVDSLRRVSASPNCDELSPMARRNSGTTPRAMVSLVKGWAISSASYALANSIQGEYLTLKSGMTLSAKAWNGSDSWKPLTTSE